MTYIHQLKLPRIPWPQKLDPTLITVISLPFLFLLINGNWLFDSAGSDNFMYLGYFLHYTEHVPVLEAHHKVSRLPWILPGALFYHLFGPLLGNYLLQLSFLVTALTSLYLTLKSIFNSRTAFISSILLGCYPHFYAPYGWYYHNLAAITYCFITMLGLTWATKSSHSGKYLFFAGLSYACAVHTNLLALLVGPLMFFHFLVLNYFGPKRALLRSLSEFVAGGLVITIILGLINYVTGGPFSFFSAQLNYTLWMSQGNNDTYYRPISTVIGQSYYLILPLTLLTVLLGGH